MRIRVAAVVIACLALWACGAKKPIEKPEDLCLYKQEIAFAANLADPAIEELVQTGVLDPMVLDIWEGYKPCRDKFLGAFNLWCLSLPPDSPLAPEAKAAWAGVADAPPNAVELKASGDKNAVLCGVATFMSLGASGVRGYFEMYQTELPPELRATYLAFVDCTLATANLLRERGNCLGRN